MGAPGRAEPGERTAGSGAAAGPRPHCRFPPPGAALGELSPAAAAAESCDSAAGFARALPAPPAAPAGSWHTPGTGAAAPARLPAPGAGPRQVRGGRSPGPAGPPPAARSDAAGTRGRARGRLRDELPGGQCPRSRSGFRYRGLGIAARSALSLLPWAEPAPSQLRQSPLILRDKIPAWRVYLPSAQTRQGYFPQEAIC
ncbi:unnamed protein product [Coccothraustes coccothraustes]